MFVMSNSGSSVPGHVNPLYNVLVAWLSLIHKDDTPE